VPLSQIECPICGEPTVVNAMGDGRLICSCASHYEIPGTGDSGSGDGGSGDGGSGDGGSETGDGSGGALA
jgi:hypothetical protein